ncbi:metal-sensitive transcriptional regulator [Arthrobacter castelli]|uniref:metal-sensitive transcriptional regulator n=1 Tax=Arthrobacter castelli TaxID=271431 RepID=UPI00040DE384|nr:metal-sensitive transcriptional regulator [Arthrobacter castelli]
MTTTDDGAVPEAGPTATSEVEPAGGACQIPGHHHGYIQDKQRYQRRLTRIEGQVRGIQRMVDEEQYCIDILTQVSAIQSALRNVARGLLDDHLRHCVADAAKNGGTEADQILKEASEAIGRLMRG